MNHSVCVPCAEDHSPSVWDLLRKMVLARAWSDGLDSKASSEETRRVHDECFIMSVCQQKAPCGAAQISLVGTRDKAKGEDGKPLADTSIKHR